MTAAMTDSERALWIAAQDDYSKALRVACAAWVTVHGALPEDGALQSATATVLIHLNTLRNQDRLHVRVPPQAAPTAVTSGSPQASGGPTLPSACPRCGGPLWDNRENKKNPKAPDWKCKNKACVDDKGYTTGGWVKPPKGANSKPAPTGNYEDMPEALVGSDDDGDSLPF